MNEKRARYIEVVNASENNLKGISLKIPHNKIIAVTGVSGSGKSSLAFNSIAQIGQKRYLETFSEYTKAYLGKIGQPKIEALHGITPVVAVSQKTSNANSRSTVGTLIDIFDYFKILYARLSQNNLSKSHFSFNTEEGACSKCVGLGLEEFISVDKLIANPNLTLREGALVPTLPNGYIVYSQVTVDVLNTVCEAHGFSVDIPWNKLTSSQKEVILNGSIELKVPYGKHSLESRLKWTGIKAKPREEGFYKGMLPTMTDILKRDRNKNILRFVDAKECSVCEGKRYKKEILLQELNGITWKEILTCDFQDFLELLDRFNWKEDQIKVAAAFTKKIKSIVKIAVDLGLGHLSFDRSSETLSGGELQRIRLLNQVSADLSDLTYVFDEPSIGLHPAQNEALISVFQVLKNRGNTVVVVEHDLKTIAHADWIIEIGPLAGEKGGELLFNGSFDAFIKQNPSKVNSHTLSALLETETIRKQHIKHPTFIQLDGCKLNNLKNIDAQFIKQGLTCVAGVSGAGKTSLVNQLLVPEVKKGLKATKSSLVKNAEDIKKVIVVDQKPIGRTSRSNPATYTGLADKIRDLFSKTEAAKKAGFKKSNFSFNTKGGRCEKCLGSGVIEIGMHFLSNVLSPCEECNGNRFNKEVLEINYKGYTISDVYVLSVSQALELFSEEKSIYSFLALLDEIGLGYIQLGQASTTLSGGEAQRIKLVSELHKQSTPNALYVLDEPSIGLHPFDLKKVILILKKIVEKGNSIVCITHNTLLLKQADYILELGPEAGNKGGEIIGTGHPSVFKVNKKSKIAPFLFEANYSKKENNQINDNSKIEFHGISTHNLKNVSLSFPKYKLNVVVGVSGSGKSSFAVNTLFSEAQTRYAENLSNHLRGKLKLGNEAIFEEVKGLTSAVKIDRKTPRKSNFSTVGTSSGIYDALRLLFARMATLKQFDFSVRDFSFNQKAGACLSCDGKGFELKFDVHKVIKQEHEVLSVEEGLFGMHKATRFYAEKSGQYYAVLKQAALEKKIDLSLPWKELEQEQKEFILNGDITKEYEVTWKTKEEEQILKSPWLGFVNYVEKEYLRRILNKNIEDLLDALSPNKCATCNGDRLREPQRSFRFQGKSIGDLSKLSIVDFRLFFAQLELKKELEQGVLDKIRIHLMPLLDRIINLGVGYLSIDRATHTLSGGEFQRINLAGQLANKLSGVTYVIDEPLVGLHPKNYASLFTLFDDLIKQKNTLLVVEHNPALIRRADFIIEFGKAAGVHGGNLIHQGTLEELKANKASIYRQYLDTEYPLLTKRSNSNVFGIKNLDKYNLPSLSASFNTAKINALTGFSGSGKSTLIKALYNGEKEAFGLDKFQAIHYTSQDSWLTHASQTPVSLLGVLEDIQKVFAQTDTAKIKKYKKNNFSFNHKLGRCSNCKGKGYLTTSMDFVQDVESVCTRCNGLRFKDEVLEVIFQDKNCAEVLKLSFHEAIEFFKDFPKITTKISSVISIGLGYLNLGQPLNKMSSGEKQRLKLALQINLKVKNTLFLLDEPSAGLHPKDIAQLINVFEILKENGNTIVFVEHNQQLIASADTIINLSK
ncbi:MAG: ATP-binding cassette domain-containing protein [Lishizhenia sp.]